MDGIPKPHIQSIILIVLVFCFLFSWLVVEIRFTIHGHDGTTVVPRIRALTTAPGGYDCWRSGGYDCQHKPNNYEDAVRNHSKRDLIHEMQTRASNAGGVTSTGDPHSSQYALLPWTPVLV